MKNYSFCFLKLCSIKKHPMPDKITSREMQILNLIANEHTIEQIAEKLQISISTVESHRRNMFRKTGVKSVVGLIKEAIKQNWISIEST
ncbi:response regulator transcription factor [Emticicia sp. BO119]|uniref:response regulator transcription factor n=1 Tax=Emticicia sp. BO119 TaxID=2757768 RepID=UPI001E2B0EF0|nr:LuxR C-terminal-related transcriptional regulator [Emticicia sp. BO119]